MPRLRSLLDFTLAATTIVCRVSGVEGHARGKDISSVFFVARSNNKNQVHYGLRVDAACNPVGPEPVYGYWRMLENRGEIEPILAMETPAYGVRDVQPLPSYGDTKSLRVRLRAFPERPILISITKPNDTCEAVATIPIAGVDARLSFIYVKLKWPFGIDHVLLRGTTADGRRVEEVVHN